MKAGRSSAYTHVLFDFDGKMAAANLLILWDFTLISTWPELAANTKEEFDEWLADRGLLWKERPRPNCGNPQKVTNQAGGTGDDVSLKFECFKRQCRQRGIPYEVEYVKGTFLETLRGDRKKIFLASCLFAYDLGLVKEVARTLKVDEKSIVQWTQWFRVVLVDYYTINVTRIEGPNTVVRVDETQVASTMWAASFAGTDSLEVSRKVRSLFSWRSRMIAALQTPMPSSRGM
ncbi:hypothetical protein Y032_0021g362 [Ancylostoma ceylanicum]|uniref:Uncharacterized protein n=2 Tax=Ancylostoma ceylanicum TaxID=53326 RepID=A0A016V0Z3_9BILA|nr:hypothetical protein Y032_0021g362 [Ancylostoma ceylanicum]